MKIWVLAGLMTVVTAPFAAAAETTVECQLDNERRQVQRVDAPAPPVAPTTTARPTVAPRETAAPQSNDQETRQAAADRRRSGKRIPDAELIGPRGAL